MEKPILIPKKYYKTKDNSLLYIVSLTDNTIYKAIVFPNYQFGIFRIGKNLYYNKNNDLVNISGKLIDDYRYEIIREQNDKEKQRCQALLKIRDANDRRTNNYSQ